MKKEKRRFMRTTLIFILFVIVLLALFNAAYSWYVIPQKNIFKSEVQFAATSEQNISILFFGDSHVARSVNPEFIPGSFNYAVPSEIYEQTFFKVRNVLEEGTTASIFVFPIDLHDFSMYRSAPYVDAWYWKTKMSYAELARVSNNSLLGVAVKANFPFFGNGLEAWQLLANPERTPVLQGWQANDADFSQKSNRDAIGLARAQKHFPAYPEIFNERLVKGFISTLELAKAHNKTIVFVAYPVSAEYLAGAQEVGITPEAFYATLNTLLERFAPDAYIFDYLTTYANQSVLFSDSDHLNVRGASTFSLDLNEDLETVR
ncbi:MAG: hypothetical protein H6502_03170 [Candidatus Woesearchaeota archaeon]|nr:MAG: hypothetical protein H6502_03170 [Candidatus Woesearchaeota archaeon]